MLDYFFEYVNNTLNSIKLFLEKKKKIIFFLFFFFIFLNIIILLLNLNSYFSIPNLNDLNFFTLFLKGGLFYIIWLLCFIKIQLFNFLIFFPFFFLVDFFENSIYTFFLDFFYVFKFFGYDNLINFYNEQIISIKNNYNFLNNLGFLKKFLYFSNTPLFFYFGLLFILSTVFSLFLLSYLGLYGVFFLNLLTIVMF